MNLKKRAEIYRISPKDPDSTMIPCPYCLTFHSVHEYFRNEMQWRGDVLEARMNLYTQKYDTACPVCRGRFILCANEKHIGTSTNRLSYFSILKNYPKKS